MANLIDFWLLTDEQKLEEIKKNIEKYQDEIHLSFEDFLKECETEHHPGEPIELDRGTRALTVFVFQRLANYQAVIEQQYRELDNLRQIVAQVRYKQ